MLYIQYELYNSYLFSRAKELREAVSAPLAKYFVEHLSDLIKDSKSTVFTTCVLNSLDSKVCSLCYEAMSIYLHKKSDKGLLQCSLPL